MADDEVDPETAFSDAQERWRRALEAHRLAPPDAGFSARLTALADASGGGLSVSLGGRGGV